MKNLFVYLHSRRVLFYSTKPKPSLLKNKKYFSRQI
ncbi:unnamed protein product [Brassica rapa subsp. narinosa]